MTATAKTPYIFPASTRYLETLHFLDLVAIQPMALRKLNLVLLETDIRWRVVHEVPEVPMLRISHLPGSTDRTFPQPHHASLLSRAGPG